MITETELTTLALVKDWLPVSTRNTSDDAQLSALISACSGDFLRATNRPDLLAADYTEVRQGDGGARMVLYHWPIAIVASLKVAGVTIAVSADKIASGWYIDEDIDPERVFNLYLNGYSFTDGAVVQIGYTAGYATTPPDIQQAVTDWVAYRYKQLPNLGITQSRSVEGESVQQTQLDAPATALAVIERYKRRLPSVSRRYDEAQPSAQSRNRWSGR
jgi:hypothetical protein